MSFTKGMLSEIGAGYRVYSDAGSDISSPQTYALPISVYTGRVHRVAALHCTHFTFESLELSSQFRGLLFLIIPYVLIYSY